VRSDIKNILGLLGLSLIFRILSLDQSLWLDEATGILVARNLSFSEIIREFSPGDFHPPLYYLVLKLWINLFGASEIAARSLSVFFGISTVLVTYKLASLLFNRAVGVVAGILLATAPLHIYYSQEARMYAMETFLAALVVLVFTKIYLSKEVRAGLWILLGLSSVALLYTNYLPYLIFIFLAVVLLWERKLLKKYGRFWGTVVIGLIASFLPWWSTFINQIEVGTLAKENTPLWWQTLGRTNLKQLLLIPVKFLIGRISFYDKTFYSGFVALYGFIFSIPLFLSLKNFSKAKFVWLWLFIPLTGAVLMGWFASGLSYFRLIFLLPPFYILLAWGLFHIRNTKTRTLLGATIVLLNGLAATIYLSNPRFHREDWRSAVSWIEQDAKGQNAASAFVTNSQQDPYKYYSKTVPSYGPGGLNRGDFEKIYLFRYVQPIFDPHDNVRKAVESADFLKTDERDFNGVTIWEYERI